MLGLAYTWQYKIINFCIFSSSFQSDDQKQQRALPLTEGLVCATTYSLATLLKIIASV